jgi:hypothetical protein
MKKSNGRPYPYWVRTREHTFHDRGLKSFDPFFGKLKYQSGTITLSNKPRKTPAFKIVDYTRGKNGEVTMWCEYVHED